MKRIWFFSLFMGMGLVGLSFQATTVGYAAGNKVVKKAKGLSLSSKTVVKEFVQRFSQAESTYKRAYKNGRIWSWVLFHQARAYLKGAKTLYKKNAKKLQKEAPSLAAKMASTLEALHGVFTKKSHPQFAGRLSYSLMLETYPLSGKGSLPSGDLYKETLSRVSKQLVAEKTAGGYQVGLMAFPKTWLHRWIEVGKSERRISLKPSSKANQMIAVFLRDAKTGAPLSGADVSLEFLDAKTKKQLSTQRLHFMWSGYPLFAANVKVPSGKKTIVQITVSPAAITRTGRSIQAYRKGVIVQFAAQIQSKRLAFKKPTPTKATARLGKELLAAIASVGGQVAKTSHLYRLGIAMVPAEKLWLWKGGSVAAQNPAGSTQVIVFLQDMSSGMLIPDARLRLFIYVKGKNKRRLEYRLMPVYDGYSGYRKVVELPKGDYDIRVRVDAPHHFRFSPKRLMNYSFELSNLNPLK